MTSRSFIASTIVPTTAFEQSHGRFLGIVVARQWGKPYPPTEDNLAAERLAGKRGEDLFLSRS